MFSHLPPEIYIYLINTRQSVPYKDIMFSEGYQSIPVFPGAYDYFDAGLSIDGHLRIRTVISDITESILSRSPSSLLVSIAAGSLLSPSQPTPDLSQVRCD